MPKRVTTLSADSARELLRDVDPAWKAFWFRNGVIAMNLADLAAALTHIGEEDYLHHISDGRSDVSMWVQQVLGDGALAKKLKAAKTSKAAAMAAHQRLEELQGIAEEAKPAAPKPAHRPKASRAAAGA